MSDLLPYLPAFVAAYGLLLVGGASPGPAVAMLMGLSFGQGRRAALIACLGIAAGATTNNLLTMAGVGLLLSQAAWAMTTLKLAGAAYLAWLAFGALRKAIHPPALATAETAPRGAVRLLLMGYAMQVTNPKSIVFWLAIAALSPTAGAPLWVAALFVGSCFALSFCTHAAWALLLSTAHVRAIYTRSRRWIEGALGVFFALFAFRLATDRS
ncbi:LysE family translocator [Jannaschia marina]|uniref:LysE family translocator n=1 Tax=Jannaschia marina TaxID=2741674 RepID=UPI0015CAB662|nr:LysE family translocator [Jannaschia marina]